MEHPADAPAPSAEHTTDTSITDFRAATAAHWRAAFLHGEVTAVELATTALTAAAANPQLGAFLHLDADYALARAAETDAVRTMVLSGRSGQERSAALSLLSAHSPLLGLPTAFKDLVQVAGLPTTAGTAAFPPVVPARDDPLARRVHAAGALSVGKTQVPEFGLPCYSENTLSEPARNPLDMSRTAGGSSGGAATAVAGGLLPLAPGNDGGGSVRIPAASCGLVGLKPGRRRLPDDRRDRTVRNLMTSGPIAESPEDAALLFDVMAGHRFSLPGTGRRRGRRRDADVVLGEGPAMRAVRRATEGGQALLRVGVTTESPFSPELDITLADEAVIAMEKGLTALESAGHLVQGIHEAAGNPRRRGGGGSRGRGPRHRTEAERFWPSGYHHDFQVLWTSRLGEAEFTEKQLGELAPLTRHFIELARGRPAQRTREAQANLQAFADQAEDYLAPWDVLLTPMLGFAPPEVGWFAGLTPEENYIQQCRFTPYSSVVNVMGVPAVNVPTHTDKETGLSWSVQLIGHHGSEEQLLALAAQMMR